MNRNMNYFPLLSVLVLCLIICGTSYAQNCHLCSRVVDGDTLVIEMNSGSEKIRLIGVDTPETVHPQKPVEYYGKEASAFTQRMVENKIVRLEYDWQQRDKYGRILAYVYLEDGTFLNAEIIKHGYGFAYTRFPFKYFNEFREYEKQARESKLGLWKDQPSTNDHGR